MVRIFLVITVLAMTAAGSKAFAAAEGASTTLSTEKLRGGSRYDQLGVGLQLGSLSGLSFEYWDSTESTYTAGLMFTRGNTAASLAHMWMFQDTFSGDAKAFVPFAGAGGLAVWANSSRDASNINYNNDRFTFSAQLPLGIEFLPADQRFGVFGELVPSLELVPYVIGYLNSDIGVRLYF